MAENDSRLARRNVKSLLEAGLMSHDHQISVLENRYWAHLQKVWVALPCMIIVER